MFSHEGTGRSALQNRLVAGSLAFVGGFVNSAGFVVLGAFTSHVTGNVGRMADELAQKSPSASLQAAALVAAFYLGALTVGCVIESNAFEQRSRAYAAALALETAALAGFLALPFLGGGSRQGMASVLLALAMGIQNGLVTRLSGAVVRTTHLTGVVTDLGIETARWLRFWRRRTQHRPPLPRLVLLLLIFTGFSTGALTGAFAAVAIGRAAMFFPAVAVAGCALYASRGPRASSGATSAP